MYDMNLLHERAAGGATFRNATRVLFVLGLAAILVHMAHRGYDVWNAERARTERLRTEVALAARERTIEDNLAARTEWLRARATRVLWGPSLTTLSQILPPNMALASMVYEREAETAVFYFRGGSTEDRGDFLRLVRVDPILAQSFGHFSIVEESPEGFTLLAEVRGDR